MVLKFAQTPKVFFLRVTKKYVAPFWVGVIFRKTYPLAGEWRSSRSTRRLLGVKFNPLKKLIKPKKDYFLKKRAISLYFPFFVKKILYISFLGN